MTGRAAVPGFATTTRLFAGSMGLSPEALMRGFRRATAEDLTAIVQFRNRDQWDDEAYLRWRYGLEGPRRGPYGELWMLELAGVLRGLIGTEWQPILYNGIRSEGQLLMDLQLDAAAEGAGGGVWLNQAMFDKAAITLAVGANRNSIGLVRRLFGALPERSYYVLPLDVSAMLRQRRLPRQLAGVASPLMVGAWRARSWCLRVRQDQPIEVREMAYMDDDLLDQVHASLPGDRCIVAPSASQLAWRLQHNPRATYRIFAGFRDGRCEGYLAARVVAGAASVLRMHVLDWKGRMGEGDHVVARLLTHIIAVARDQGCSTVYTTALDRDGDATLGRLGFFRGRSSIYRLNGLHAADPALQQDLLASEWRITDLSFDNDGCY